jgi:hypothetical protein
MVPGTHTNWKQFGIVFELCVYLARKKARKKNRKGIVMKKIAPSMIVALLMLSVMASSVYAGSSRQSVFGDLSLSSQFYEPMYSLYLKEIYEGEETDKGFVIHPLKNVTRGDAAYMLYHLLGLTYVDGKDFKDVPKSHDYFDAIETLASLGVIDGFTDGTFRPLDSLTRGQMAKIIASAFEYQIDSNASIPYKDVTAAFKPFVHALSKEGITKGITATQFAPNRFISRQEMAAFMDRAYKKVPGSEYNEYEVLNTVNEATRKVRVVTIQGLEKHFPNRDAADISDDLKAITVDPYYTWAIDNYKAISCYECDADIRVRDFDFGFDYTIKQANDSSIIVDAIAPETYFYSGYRGTIELVRVNGAWKTKSLKKTSLDVAPLHLTIEEATNYLKYAIPVYWNEEVNSIKYTGIDSISGEAVFLVNGKTNYYINLKNGATDSR